MSPHRRPIRVNSQRTFNRTAYDQSVLFRKQTPAARVPRADQKTARFKFRAALVVLALLVFGGHNLWANHVSAQNVAAKQAQQAAAAAQQKKTDALQGQLNALIAANPSIDLSVATASSDGVRVYGETSAFDGASTAKLLTAVDYLHHVERGDASLSQRIEGKTARAWIKAMLVESDDAAWNVLNTYLTHNDLASYADSIGFAHYNVENNTFTAGDMALLLQKLYNGKLLNDSYRSLVLGYMNQANFRQYIVAAVPDSNKVYHKTGIDNDTVNDAAIIKHGNKYVVLVIFTDGNGTYSWDVRAKLMQTITKDTMAAYL